MEERLKDRRRGSSAGRSSSASGNGSGSGTDWRNSSGGIACGMCGRGKYY